MIIYIEIQGKYTVDPECFRQYETKIIDGDW